MSTYSYIHIPISTEKKLQIYLAAAAKKSTAESRISPETAEKEGTHCPV